MSFLSNFTNLMDRFTWAYPMQSASHSTQESADLPKDQTFESNQPTSNALGSDDDYEFVNPADADDDYEFVNPADENEINLDASELPNSPPTSKIGGFTQQEVIQMCGFSKITYCSSDERLKSNGYKTIEELEQEGYKVIPFRNSYEHAGHVFIKGKDVIIAYRGTKSLNNLITDSNVLFATSEFLPDGGRMHCGFYRSFKDSWDNVSSIIKNHAKEEGISVKDIHYNFTGHSMGGSIAKIGALCVNKVLGTQNIHVATFADPRVFDLTASTIYNEAIGDNTVRVTQHRRDPVPAGCPGSFGYAHVGAQIRVPLVESIMPHKIDGYHLALKNITPKDFVEKNGVSYFYYPSKVLQHLNAFTLGQVQHFSATLRRSFWGRCNWSHVILNQEATQGPQPVACK